jgi:hypothetical protein
MFCFVALQAEWQRPLHMEEPQGLISHQALKSAKAAKSKNLHSARHEFYFNYLLIF